MSEFLAIAVGIVMAVVLLLNFGEAIATGVAALFVAVARWVQKVFFGIDKPVVGADSLVGRLVSAEAQFSPAADSGVPEGYVVVDGERWRARPASGTECFSAGEELRVAGRKGLVLLVSRAPH